MRMCHFLAVVLVLLGCDSPSHQSSSPDTMGSIVPPSERLEQPSRQLQSSGDATDSQGEQRGPEGGSPAGAWEDDSSVVYTFNEMPEQLTEWGQAPVSEYIRQARLELDQDPTLSCVIVAQFISAFGKWEWLRLKLWRDSETGVVERARGPRTHSERAYRDFLQAGQYKRRKRSLSHEEVQRLITLVDQSHELTKLQITVDDGLDALLAVVSRSSPDAHRGACNLAGLLNEDEGTVTARLATTLFEIGTDRSDTGG